MQKIEETGFEFSENLYLAYADTLTGEKQTFYQSYIINPQLTVTLEATQNIVNHSTTGLIVWEASKFLVDWGIENAALLKEKTILELGSGLGLLGIALCQLVKFSKYIFSDNSQDVLRILKKNIDLNFYHSEYNKLNVIQKQKEKFNNFANFDDGNDVNKPEVSNLTVLPMEWKSATCGEINKYNPDIILGSDITYDPDIFDDLIHVLCIFLKCSKNRKAYLSMTERNKTTLTLFLHKTKEAGLHYIKEANPREQHFVYTEEAPIHVYKIYF
ncbi:protein-lysine N-methyltransferase EEF2KMT isoform X2 [Centruroides vittatus]